MRTVCVWRDEEDYSRSVSEWIREFERRTGREVESISPDTREGESICNAYDVVEYPTILVLRDDGSVVASWRGRSLPLFDEVAYWG